ncbi:hypothetical protein RVD_145 [viral metagenome]
MPVGMKNLLQVWAVIRLALMMPHCMARLGVPGDNVSMFNSTTWDSCRTLGKKKLCAAGQDVYFTRNGTDWHKVSEAESRRRLDKSEGWYIVQLEPDLTTQIFLEEQLADPTSFNFTSRSFSGLVKGEGYDYKEVTSTTLEGKSRYEYKTAGIEEVWHNYASCRRHGSAQQWYPTKGEVRVRTIFRNGNPDLFFKAFNPVVAAMSQSTLACSPSVDASGSLGISCSTSTVNVCELPLNGVTWCPLSASNFGTTVYKFQTFSPLQGQGVSTPCPAHWFN